MKKSVLSLAAFVLAGSFSLAFAGDVTGKVTLKGTPPAETPIDFSDHPECGDLHPTVTTSRRYTVGKDNGLKDVFVYVSKGLEGKTFPIPSEAVELEQQKATYQPYVVGIMVGQKLRVKNADPMPVIHNVHITPKADGNEEVNVMQATQYKVDEFTFAKPDVLVKVNCNVHPWMLAYVGVAANPFYAVTDADGHFKIPNLPPGEYTLTAYHLKVHGATPGATQTIKVDANNSVTANFTLEVPAP